MDAFESNIQSEREWMRQNVWFTRYKIVQLLYNEMKRHFMGGAWMSCETGVCRGMARVRDKCVWESMHDLLRQMDRFGSVRCEIRVNGSEDWTWLPAKIPSCSDIPEGKSMEETWIGLVKFMGRIHRYSEWWSDARSLNNGERQTLKELMHLGTIFEAVIENLGKGERGNGCG